MNTPKLGLHYRDAEGQYCLTQLGTSPIRIGRDPNADIVLENERVTRAHCEIQLWNDDYVLKDLRSKNGTYINDKKVDLSLLHVNDVIRIGPFILRLLDDAALDIGETQAGEVLKDMDAGKGFNTIMREIVDHLDEDGKPRSN